MQLADYRPKLDLRDTERAIKFTKDRFQREISGALDLQRVSAPRFLETGYGLQDDLAGTQEPVSFHVKHTNRSVEMVHSLAKWKRLSLYRYGFEAGEGLYTDMDAIRKDEKVDDIHSVYVDQWDWEKVILRANRNAGFLKETVQTIYKALKQTELALSQVYPVLRPMLPEEIHFIHTLELEAEYPELSPSQREQRAAEKYGAFFLQGIGGPLACGVPHDLRAADYDDWSSDGGDGKPGLNGDIIVYDTVRERALELSSMGIRVDAGALEKQLSSMHHEGWRELFFHKNILDGTFPLSVGGGIGQSRLCMLLLQKIHIGEVQVGVWPQEMIDEYEKHGVEFL